MSVDPVDNSTVETTVTNGVEAKVQCEPLKANQPSVTSESPETQPTTNGKSAENEDLPLEVQESALEKLAKNLETTGKYKELLNDVNEMDMIAFKVFTPSFEMSDYIIGLVESVIGKTAPEQQDFDLMLQIMGKRKKTYLI